MHSLSGFVICVDLIKSSESNVKIHVENCQHHRNRKTNAETQKWFGGFKTKEQVENKAKILSKEYPKWRYSRNCVLKKLGK